MSIERFGAKLRTLCELHGWSQRDLAQQIGVSQGQIHFMETNQRKPSAAFLLRVARVFGVSMEQLADDTLELDLP